MAGLELDVGSGAERIVAANGVASDDDAVDSAIRPSCLSD